MIKGSDYIGNAAVTICHDGKGNYLLGLRSDKCRDEHLTWDPIGSGGIEFGDTIEETIYREIKEECNADVLKIDFLGVREVFRIHEGKKTHWIQFDYKVQIDPANVKIMEPDKCLELGWFTINNFPNPLHSQFPIFLERYKDKL
ncbi:MAG: NUDIX hydrolase [Candidatus Pacebacteria bacterium]|nr:NUDIX hydrolase [Candidatus Paceibacterota bacterium]